MASLSAAYLASDPEADGASTIRLNGSGFAVKPVDLAYVHPDDTVEHFGCGVLGDGTLDNNYILASASGEWHISASQLEHKKLVQVASATVTVP